MALALELAADDRDSTPVRGRQLVMAQRDVNALAHPEILARTEDGEQAELPLASEGVLHHVWQSKFGPMLIEVKCGRAYVNGKPVEPAEPEVRPISLP
jgi:hypothetical protein